VRIEITSAADSMSPWISFSVAIGRSNADAPSGVTDVQYATTWFQNSTPTSLAFSSGLAVCAAGLRTWYRIRSLPL
jgi:hypothetical protein